MPPVFLRSLAYNEVLKEFLLPFLSQGEPGLSGLRGPEGAQGIGTQGEKVC